jgi:hypothetical protein
MRTSLTNSKPITARALPSAFKTLGGEGPFSALDSDECREVLARQVGPAWPAPIEWWKGRTASDPFYYALATQNRFISRLRPLLGDNIILWGVDLIRRKPGQGYPWHCDIESSAPDGKFASIWFGLENTSRESSLVYISPLHAFGCTIQEESARHGFKRGQASFEIAVAWAKARDQQVRPEMRDGDAIIFDGRTWHGSNDARREGIRGALLLQYAAGDYPVRMIDPNYLEWPIRFRQDNRPPVNLVSGWANGVD